MAFPVNHERTAVYLSEYNDALRHALESHPGFRLEMTIKFDGRGFHFHSGRDLAEEADLALLQEVLAGVRQRYVLRST